MNLRHGIQGLNGLWPACRKALAWAGLLFASVSPGAQSHPNVVFILADDLGYGDVACYNPESKIPTPNLDRLAKEGMLFTDAHSPSTVCTPTRYSVLTGRIWEYDLDGNMVGVVVDHDEPGFGGAWSLPQPYGTPQGIAVGEDGPVHYADLDLQGSLPNIGPGSDGKVWRVRPNENADGFLTPEIVRDGLAFPDGVATAREGASSLPGAFGIARDVSSRRRMASSMRPWLLPSMFVLLLRRP